MRTSTIAKHRAYGPDSDFARLLGAEIHRRRLALGLSQLELAGPLSKAFVSLIEHGRVVPSLPSLVLIARRLETSPGALLLGVNPGWTEEYTDPHATSDTLPRRRGPAARPPDRDRHPR
jgi:transcriptional regulator with XRE-family HTH domain